MNNTKKEQQSFWVKSYESHSEHDNSPDIEKLESWKRFDTIDAWRHKRMYDNLLPLIHNYPLSKWLTIGDGRYGTDANFLIRNKITDVLATSISDVLLKKSKDEGFINDYRVENAEKLSFEDNFFDFVFCKEAYHHFPRPMIALYEMIRVAKTGVIVIEPVDQNVKIWEGNRVLIKPISRWQLIKNFIKDFLGIKRYLFTGYTEPLYENSGNYIYTISQREFEKVALALNYPVIAFRGMNDYYEEGVEFETAEKSSALFNKVLLALKIADEGCLKGLKNYGLLVSIIFKAYPDENTLSELSNMGFTVKRLTRNPFL